MKRYQSLSFNASILVVLCYLVFTLLAYSRFQLPYSPIWNWLSDLGNVNLNPHGAIWYNIGIILTALLLLVFFLGLSRWKIGNKRIQIIMVVLTQVFGILGSVCMIMSAIFPINFSNVHSFWSVSLYIMLATAFAFSVAMLRYHQQVPRWLLALGVSTAVMVNLTSFLPTVYLLEWITVLLFLGYVCLVGVETKRLESGRH
jgi:hypothetical membrane protein